MYWNKLSASISYFINKSIWGEQLLESNEDLLNYYIDMALEEENGVYKYLDKKTYEYIELSDEDMDRIVETFLDRIEKKKIKYADEIEEIRSNKIFREAREYLTEELEKENKNKLKGFKVIEFPKKK